MIDGSEHTLQLKPAYLRHLNVSYETTRSKLWSCGEKFWHRGKCADGPTEVDPGFGTRAVVEAGAVPSW